MTNDLREKEVTGASFGPVSAASGFDPSRGYVAALPHLRAARLAYLAAVSGLENPCDEIFSHKWLDPVCVGRGCQSLVLKLAVKLLKNVTFMARTSGGTAGPDKQLMAACDEAETFLVALRDTDRSGEADETAKQAQPEARAGAEGIAQPIASPKGGSHD